MKDSKKILISVGIPMFGLLIFIIAGFLGRIVNINEYILHGIQYFAVVLGVLSLIEFIVIEPIFMTFYKIYMGLFGGRSSARIISVEDQSVRYNKLYKIYYVGIEYDIFDKYENKEKMKSHLNIINEIELNVFVGNVFNIVYNKHRPKSVLMDYKVKFTKSPFKIFLRLFIMVFLLTVVVIGNSHIINNINKGNDKFYFNFLTGLSRTEKYKKGTLIYESNSTFFGKAGPVKEYYPSGQLKLESFYKKGQVIGPVKEYYENGNLKKIKEEETKNRQSLKRTIKEYSKDGNTLSENITEKLNENEDMRTYKEYYDNGQLKREILILEYDGVEDKRTVKEYYENGDIQEESYKDETSSTSKKYYKGGKVQRAEHEDEHTSTLKKYYENGFLEMEDIENKKPKERTHRTYYDNGQLKEEYFHKNHKKNGIEKSYHQNGNIEREIPWENGKYNGLEKWYYKSGKIKRESPYENGKQEGMEKEYYESGKIKRESPYENGKQEGIEKWYYESGKIERETLYKDDVRGKSTRYNEDGTIYDFRKSKTIKIIM